MTPCTELLAIEAIEEMLAPPLILMSLPERVQLTPGEPEDDGEETPF